MEMNHQKVSIQNGQEASLNKNKNCNSSNESDNSSRIQTNSSLSSQPATLFDDLSDHKTNSDSGDILADNSMSSSSPGSTSPPATTSSGSPIIVQQGCNGFTPSTSPISSTDGTTATKLSAASSKTSRE